MSKKKIVALITVRAGSKRVPHKNIRPFGDSNLLIRKIRQLKNVSEISNIVVSSDSDEMLKMAKQEGCIINKRPIEYCDEKSKTFNEMVEYVTKNCPGDIILWTPCVCPFTNEKNFNQAIEAYNKYVENGSYDSVVSSKVFKEYLFDKTGPHNFSIKNHVKSQDLPDWKIIVNGFFMAPRTDMQKWRFVYGPKPYLVTLSKKEAIDIDDMDDFKIASSLL